MAEAKRDEVPLPEPYCRLAEVLSYDAETGVFRWIVSRGPIKAGAIAGSPHGKYWGLRVFGKTIFAHRAALVLVSGSLPPAGSTVDHIDGNKLNNAWANLRVISMADNNRNIRKATKKNRSGLLGAHWNSQDSRWQSGIKLNGKRIHLGKFATPEEAHEAYVKAKRKLHSSCTI